MDECPMCGREIDDDDDIVSCSECGEEGSTACCMRDGICEACREESGYEDDEDEDYE